MITSKVVQYGPCPCRGQFENRQVEIRMTLETGTVHLNDVPQGACPVCGSRVYKAEVLERIEAMMSEQKLDPRLNRQ